jgi:hypothetical protein
MKRLGQSALLFIALFLALYAGVYFTAERLMWHTGHSNPFYKIETAPQTEFDWVILGASHAMPLAFGDFNTTLEHATGSRILNLASPGTGPLYNRFVLEEFLRRHRARNLLYVVDSFAFYSRTWNEDRFADAKLLRRTPLTPQIAQRLWSYVRAEGVDARAVLDYASGFSKINNRERFQRDVWEGEAQFERVARPSKTALGKRIDYLYPNQTSPATRDRYLEEFSELIDLAQRAGMRVVALKMPVPPQFRAALPDEASFDAAVGELVANRAVRWHDYSAAIAEPRLYFDTDHLNRAGLTEFVARDLQTVLRLDHTSAGGAVAAESYR